MANLPISGAAVKTGAQTASGDLFPLLDVSAAAGSQGSKITRDQLGAAMLLTADVITALAAKLALAGGTMTGALTVPAGAVGTPSLLFTGAGATTGIYSTGAGVIDIAIAGVRRYWFDGSNLNTSGVGIQVTNGNILGQFAYLRTDTGGALSIGASDDVKIGRGGGAATLQLGVDHATTATAQKIKAHDVAGGNGASLTIEGGGGGGDGALYLGSTTAHPVGFHGASVPQATTSISAASITPNSSGIADDSATWDGYTIGKVVNALREKGILA